MNTNYDENNICLMSDSYKMWHYKGYMPNTRKIYSYLEARKGAKYNKTLFYGLQYIIKKHLLGNVVTQEKIDQACQIIDSHLGKGVFNYEGWKYILNKYDGKLPVYIKAVAEGSLVNIDNVLMTIENTDENVPWLTNYLETILMNIWYPITVATQDWETRKLIEHYYNVTKSDKSGIDFALHGFGMRANTCVEAAEIGDSAHLLNFKGTDTVPALLFAYKYYNAQNCPGYSVAATEHSIMSSRAEEGEWEVVENIFNAQPNGILSIVIDTYNWQRFIDVCGTKYHDLIMNRNGRVVFRPDSGDPVSVTLDILEKLGQYFGFTRNEASYKVLDPHVRMLWGDGIDYQGVRNILFNMKNNGWAAENIVFGMGGHMIQSGLTRDTQRFAFKCSSTMYDNTWHDVYKKPLDITKASKRGRLALLKVDGDDGEKFYKTVREEECDLKLDQLIPVFKNGELLKEYNFEEIRCNILMNSH